jgi:hypothetical protein
LDIPINAVNDCAGAKRPGPHLAEQRGLSQFAVGRGEREQRFIGELGIEFE